MLCFHMVSQYGESCLHFDLAVDTGSPPQVILFSKCMEIGIVKSFVPVKYEELMTSVRKRSQLGFQLRIRKSCRPFITLSSEK